MPSKKHHLRDRRDEVAAKEPAAALTPVLR
jgi:hypothetical protein